MRKRTWIWLGIGVFLLLGCIFKVKQNNRDYANTIADAVYIEDVSTVDSSLVGKYVIVSGTPEMRTGAYDADFDVRFDYPAVYRTAYVLYDTGTGSEHVTEWQKAYRSEKNPHGSVTLLGEAGIGAYTFGGDALNFVFKTSPDVLVTEELAKQIGWIYCKHWKLTGVWLLSRPFTYKNDVKCWLDAGMLRFTYTAKSKKGIPCTVCGILEEDGHLAPVGTYGVKYQTGILDKESFLAKYQ